MAAMADSGSRPQVSIAVLARHAGRVLLVKTAATRRWGPVPGVVMDGETPIEAAWRELWEKTGLHGRMGSGDSPGRSIVTYRERRGGDERVEVLLTFVADVPDREITPSDELIETRWIGSAGETGDGDPELVDLVRAALAAEVPEAVALVRRWLASVKARDIEAVASLYAESAEHSSPELRSSAGFQPRFVVKGRESIAGWWAELLDSLPGLHYEERSVAWSGNHVIVECVRVVPGTPAIRMALSFACDAGRIHASYVYRS